MAGTIPCSRPATSIEPFTIEYCENNQKVITTANQRKEKYHKEPMETENKANCLKRGKTLVTRSWLVQGLHLIGVKRGAGFLVQSLNKVHQP